MNTLEQQLVTKCHDYGVILTMTRDSISLDVEAPRAFGTTGTHWEYCVIPNCRDLATDRKTKFSPSKARNESIRLMLDALDTLYTLPDGEWCLEGECEECEGYYE